MELWNGMELDFGKECGIEFFKFASSEYLIFPIVL